MVGVVITGSVSLSPAETLRVVGFNVESGGADPGVVDDLIARLQDVDIWGFSEVQNDSWARLFEIAAEDGEGADFVQVLGSTGGGDRLLITYDAERFELLQQFELHDINPEGRVRAPLVAHLKVATTGQEFLFMVNHLFRTNNAARHEQARLLNAWAREQTLPVIAVGDYNYDWDVADGETRHDQGFDEMTREEVFVWVRPPALVATQCSRQFNSVLDFVFAAGAAKAWQGRSEILERQPEYCPDTNATSDHRPILATFTISGSSPQSGGRAAILERIERIESELRDLKVLIEQLPE
jgi:endonuclease/exonuclease/phosphatase family metal-dependent hydrolase